MHVPLRRGVLDTVAAGFSATHRHLHLLLILVALNLLSWLGSRRPTALLSAERVPLASAGGTVFTNASTAIGRTVAVMIYARNRSYTLRWING